MKYCRDCGNEIVDSAKFCKFCGTKQLDYLGNDDIDEIKKLAESGDVNACIKLGDIYKAGSSLKLNYVEALNWYEKAGELGNTNAFIKIGDIYKYILFDEEFAVKWYMKAIEMGDSEGVIKLNEVNNPYISDDVENAYYKITKEKRDIDAIIILGDFYLKQPFSTDTAKEWYKKATDLGSIKAYTKIADACLSSVFSNSNQVNSDDWKEIVNYYKKAIELGDNDAIIKLGNFYYNSYDLNEFAFDTEEEAKKCYLKALELGDSRAQVRLNNFGLNEDNTAYNEENEDNEENTVYREGNTYSIEINWNKCIGCGECVDVCPAEVYEIRNGKSYPKNTNDCLGCESCVETCENGAITVQELS